MIYGEYFLPQLLACPHHKQFFPHGMGIACFFGKADHTCCYNKQISLKVAVGIEAQGPKADLRENWVALPQLTHKGT